MGLMCLHILCAKFNATVLCIINGGSHNYGAWAQRIRYSPSGRKAVEPKHRVIYQLNYDTCWDTLKQQHCVDTSDPLF